MLALAAAQLKFKAEKADGVAKRRRIWVDVGFSYPSENTTQRTDSPSGWRRDGMEH
jgi:hypothetical protein